MSDFNTEEQEWIEANASDPATEAEFLRERLRIAIERAEAAEAKLAKKDGCLEETYRRWKNGADLRTLAKAEGCTQERMRLKMKRYEEDKVRLLEAKLAKAVEALEYYNVHGYEGKEARATLAELKGNTDAPK